MNHLQAEVNELDIQFFMNSPIPAWIFDETSLKFLHVNEAAIDKYGYSREEFLGMTIEDIRPEEDIVHLHSILEQKNSLEADIPHWRHKTKNGFVFYVEVYCKILNINGRKIRTVQAIDINDKVLTEQHKQQLNRIVRNQKEMLDDIMDTVTEVIWAIRLDTFSLVYTNAVCEEIYGYTPEEMLADHSTFLSSIHPDDREKFNASVEKAIATGRSQEEFRVRHRNGNYKIIIGTAILKKGEDGKPDMLSGIGVDVTRLRVAEDVLKDKIAELESAKEIISRDEQNLRALIDNTDNLIWSIDRQGNIIMANEVFKRAVYNKHGVDIKEGVNIYNEKFKASHIAKWRSYFERCLSGESFSVEDKYEAPGIELYLQTSFHSIMNSNNEIIGVNCMSVDISREKKYLMTLQQQNEKLKEIAWIHSHQVRGPVTTIMGLVELFNHDDPSDPANATALNGIRDTAKELDEIIHRVNNITIV